MGCGNWRRNRSRRWCRGGLHQVPIDSRSRYGVVIVVHIHNNVLELVCDGLDIRDYIRNDVLRSFLMVVILRVWSLGVSILPPVLHVNIRKSHTVRLRCSGLQQSDASYREEASLHLEWGVREPRMSVRRLSALVLDRKGNLLPVAMLVRGEQNTSLGAGNSRL